MAQIKLQTGLACPPDLVWTHVQTPALVRYVCAPRLSFENRDAGDWPAIFMDGTYRVRLRAYGWLPLGDQTIEISRPIVERVRGFEFFMLRDNGRSRLFRRWDHRIIVETDGNGHTRYTDLIDLDAGWLTTPAALFVRSLFAHRQRRLRALAKANFRALA
ncbi:MAG: hypothetical protein GC199_05930 [Alphaproteobacteria bacterium]|nr:hypothetical protein [Alphaproteobacteria bacterium]